MSQIFKNIAPLNILFNFLESVCVKTDTYYIFDNNAYKKAIIDKQIESFCSNILQYYHKSKQYYINRDITYIKFCTVIRQICKLHSVKFNTKIVYSKSKYNIPYHIYF